MRALGTAIVIACLLAGCGSADSGARTDANNRYVVAVNRAQDRFHASQQHVQDEITSATSTPAQDRRALDRFRAAVERAVADLRAIRPPTDVVALHRRLVAAVAGYLPVITDRREATSRDARTLIAARTAFTTASETVNGDVDRAIAQINARLSG